LGIVHYQVVRGAPSSFAISLPEHMDVRRVETTFLLPAGSSPRLKGWSVVKAEYRSRLVLEFQSPVTSPWQLMVELIPVEPLGAQPFFPLPVPERATSSEGFLAFRVEGPGSAVVEHRGVTGIPPGEFATLWRLAGVDDPGLPDQAYSFRRAS